MAKKYLDLDGLSRVWTKIKAFIPTKISDLTNDSIGSVTILSGGTKSLSTGTSWQNVMELELAPGSWFVVVTCNFASNATGRRGVCMSTTATGSQTGHNVLRTATAVNGTYTTLQFSFPVEVSETTTFYINAYQNSGGNLNCYPRIHRMKVI